MDIRIEKTQNVIKSAFLSLRAKKSVEKITIKELCTLAQINKSTFYSHYQDIYDLSEQMQAETVRFILGTISAEQPELLADPAELTMALFSAMLAHRSMIGILFSGKESGYLADCLELGIKEMLYERFPQYKTDPDKQVLLTFSIHGGYQAYQKNMSMENETLIRSISTISQQLKPLFDK